MMKTQVAKVQLAADGIREGVALMRDAGAVVINGAEVHTKLDAPITVTKIIDSAHGQPALHEVTVTLVAEVELDNA